MTVPLIEQTYEVVLLNGDTARVNQFDYNLSIACGSYHWIQLKDSRWIRASSLHLLNSENK